MPKKRSKIDRQTTLRVGNLSDISGHVNIAGGNINSHHTAAGTSALELSQLFDHLYTTIEQRANTSVVDKEDLKAEVHEIQSAVTEAAQKSEKVDEGFLMRRFRSIARMAPDLLEVIVATLGNPLAGLGVAVNKIAEKAREATA